MKLKYFCLFFILLNFRIKFSNCECYAKVETSPERRPIFKKHLGTHIVKIEDTISETIKMYDGERITGHCATKFDTIYNQLTPMPRNQKGSATNAIQSIAGFLNQRHVNLYCGTGTLYVGLAERQYEIEATATFSCEPMEWGIYESKSPLPWCSTETVSYILATTKFLPMSILGSLCYNLKSKTFESLRYTTFNFSVKQDHRKMPFPVDLSPHLPDIEVKLDDFLPSPDVDFSNDVDTESSNEFVNIASYMEHPIVHNENSNDLFKKYNGILQISWWKNLYHTNWHRFSKAFEAKRTQITYDVYLGMSGQLLMPQQKLCDGHETGEIRFKKHTSKIPAYIWTYVRAIDDSDEFVFISYNSPFYEFFNSSDIIFCQDICSEISWLSKVRSTFRYSNLGVSFCCSPESVRNSSILNGFPRTYKDSELKAPTTTGAPSTTTTTKIKTVQEYETEEEVFSDADPNEY